MPIDRSRVGAEYMAPEMTVTAEAIARYADATEEALPAYRAGTDPVAPPVFAIVPAWPAIEAILADGSLGLDIGRIVHGEQRMRFHRPIRAGDVLSTVGRIASVEDKGANEVLVVTLNTTNDHGEPVCDQDVVTVSRGTAASAPPAGGPRRPAPKAPGPAPPPPDVERTVDLPADMTYRYAEASGDRNRIHIDPDFAASVGLGGIIVHGMCLLAVALQGVVEEVAGGDPGRVRSLGVRFARPIKPGGPFTTRIWRTQEGVRFESVDAAGQVVLRDGRAEVG